MLRLSSLNRQRYLTIAHHDLGSAIFLFLWKQFSNGRATSFGELAGLIAPDIFSLTAIT